MDSKNVLNLKVATTNYILTQHPELKSLPEDIFTCLVEQAKKSRKRNFSLVRTCCVVENADAIRVMKTYKDVTEKELSYKIMEESEFGIEDECGMFHELLYYNKDRLKKHKIFEDVLKAIDADYFMESFGNISPSLIKYLYTKILTPEDLIKDIVVCTDDGEDCYYICPHDELTWKCLDSTLLV